MGTTIWMQLDDGAPVEVDAEPREIQRRMVRGYRAVPAPAAAPSRASAEQPSSGQEED